LKASTSIWTQMGTWSTSISITRRANWTSRKSRPLRFLPRVRPSERAAIARRPRT
jgi:hypothetical protein